jgi:DNA polymerase lambda
MAPKIEEKIKHMHNDQINYVDNLCNRLNTSDDSLQTTCFPNTLQTVKEWERRFTRRVQLEMNDSSCQTMQQLLINRVQSTPAKQFQMTTEYMPAMVPSHNNTITTGNTTKPRKTKVIDSIKQEVKVTADKNSIKSETVSQVKQNTTTSTQKSSSSQPLFHDVVVYFVRLGNLSKGRVSILSEKLVQKGGKVYELFSEKVTHVITGDKISYSKIKNACMPKTILPSFTASLDAMEEDNSELIQHLENNVHIHTAEWISASICNGSLCDEFLYRIFPEADVNSHCSNSSQQSQYSQINSKSSSDSQKMDAPSQKQQQQPQEPKPKFKWESRFACQKKPENQAQNTNQEITDELKRMLTIYQQTGEQWRTMAYRKAISAIERYPKKIETAEEAQNIFGVGKGIAEKIADFLSYGKIAKLESLQENKKIQCIQVFSKIWGVGINTAEKWYATGYRTLEDIKNNAQLNYQQEIGLKYYNDFQQRIPREEVEQICNVVFKVALDIRSSLEIVPCGSYRRGKLDSGDVDILVTDTSNDVEFDLHSVLPAIKKRLETHDSNLKRIFSDDLVQIASGHSFLVGHLSTHKRQDGGECDSYMGVCKLNNYNIARRIDIKVYDPAHFPFAILYFTGSDHFNRSMRLLANKKGLSLSDKSLRSVVRCNRKKVHEGKEIPCNTERDIFTALNLEYREPHERDI